MGSDSGLAFEKQSDLAVFGSEFLGGSEQSSDVFMRLVLAGVLQVKNVFLFGVAGTL
jgi:hypothetical protein